MTALCIAHRGGAALAPENTLSAFANAVALGADGAELDVQLTRDGEVVVVHDLCLPADLCRDSTGAWLVPPTPLIADLTREEIARFEVGVARPHSPYALAHPLLRPCEGERIPTLADVIELLRPLREFRLFIEMKTGPADLPSGIACAKLAEATIAVLREPDFLGRSILVGFDWRGLLLAKRLEPAVRCWFSTRPQSWFGDADPPPTDDPPPEPVRQLLRQWARTGTSPWAAGFDAVAHGGSLPAAIAAAGGDGWFSYHCDATPEAIAEAHARGLKVGAWTVDDPAEMAALANAGIDAVCTDSPDLKRKAPQENRP
ncbi:MAG TPA: glycerophosphodiester phosphodiesterase family protein [Rhizomicrobium sp.]|jgi:glycerophosphoryl diester phosphodiesterase